MYTRGMTIRDIICELYDNITQYVLNNKITFCNFIL